MSVVAKDFRNVLFVSRNKDDRVLNNSKYYKPFKPRIKSFVARVSPFDVSSLYDEFETFADEGVNGEISRICISQCKRRTEST